MWHFGGADNEEKKRVAPARGMTPLWLQACAHNEEQDFGRFDWQAKRIGLCLEQISTATNGLHWLRQGL
jgi:hypothetical protein